MEIEADAAECAEFLRKLDGLAGPGTAEVWIAQTGAGHVLAVVAGRDAEALAALARPLPHYGRQSWLVFDGAKALARGVWPSRPVEVRLDQN